VYIDKIFRLTLLYLMITLFRNFHQKWANTNPLWTLPTLKQESVHELLEIEAEHGLKIARFVNKMLFSHLSVMEGWGDIYGDGMS